MGTHSLAYLLAVRVFCVSLLRLHSLPPTLFPSSSAAALLLDPPLRDGSQSPFHGSVYTLKTYEDNHLVRVTLEGAGEGRVLVVDGGGSLRVALLGDQLAALAARNGWKAIVVLGAIRDAAAIDAQARDQDQAAAQPGGFTGGAGAGGVAICIKALGTSPVKSVKRGWGSRDIPLNIGGVAVQTGDYLYADRDGVLVAKKKLH